MNLTKQRDELLPLLMNGQASVNYHLSKWSIGFLCLEMHIEYDKNIIQKEADKQDFHPLVRQPYSFAFSSIQAIRFSCSSCCSSCLSR